LEPHRQWLLIRFRIDGVLHDIFNLPKNLAETIIGRIKIMSRLRTDEHRAAQDGKLQFVAGGSTVDVRVSILPVVEGENAVLRLLADTGRRFTLTDLGLLDHDLAKVKRAAELPHGMILVTGPTGSGKTTTIYALIKILNRREVHISTIEDPVEYKIEGINQVQAKPQIGLTFAAGLRAFLRQDPDIIMLGEVRDLETAQICVRAALTGHLVLSTLHTNDSSSAVTRLTDLGIEPALLAPSLVMVIAQRLVRKLCTECKEPFEPPDAIRKKVTLPAGHYFRAKGCAACRNTGFRGRNAIYEVLIVDDAIREAVVRKASAQEIRKTAQKNGTKTLFESGVDKAAAGVTTLEEAFSVTIGGI
jgi:type II secretory ATPase GspE/PulE/Tfp pilus assembly ATPase PilB-like protein